MTQDEAKTKLMTILHRDPKHDFASSMFKQSHRKALSEKQLYWVERLYNEIVGGAPSATTRQVFKLDCQGLVDLLAKAKENLKFPKYRVSIRVDCERCNTTGFLAGGQRCHKCGTDGQHDAMVVFKLASDRSRHPGSINITDDGSYGTNKYYGNLRGGIFYPGRDATPGFEQLIADISADPVGYAQRYGRVTGSCSFCGQTLTDPRSTAVGYGPVCAGNWGLPYGKKEVAVDGTVDHECPDCGADVGSHGVICSCEINPETRAGE